MLGVHPATKQSGGIWAVVDAYRRGGLFQRWPISYIGTFASGSAIRKFFIASNALLQYTRLLARNRVALVHVHSASNASFWRKSVFILIALMWRRPVIFHLHGGGFIDFYSKRCGPIRRWCVRFVLDHAAHIIVLSEEWRRRIAQITSNPHIVVIPNPTDTGPLASQRDYDRSSNVLLFLGRLDKKKGIFDLVAAVALLHPQIPDIRVRFAGEGDVDGIRRHAASNGILETIEFLGWISGELKQRVLAEATVFVLPSHAEGMPMAVLEAMAAGLPIVASRVGGVPDVVEDQKSGILFEPGDVDGLARALLALLRDPARRRQMGEASQKRIVETHTPERVLEKIEFLYEKYVNG